MSIRAKTTNKTIFGRFIAQGFGENLADLLKKIFFHYIAQMSLR